MRKTWLALGAVAMLSTGAAVAAWKLAPAPPQGPEVDTGVVVHSDYDDPGIPEVDDPGTVPGLHFGDGTTIGESSTFANLTVFPVYRARPREIGTVGAVDELIERGKAEIREVAHSTDYGEVNLLKFANNTEDPMLMLGGTLLEGGFQDRMIGSDFILRPNRVAMLKVYCAELHRWTPFRNGVNTEGKFHTMPAYADSHVRAAGQFLGQQHRVWSLVHQVNRAHCKAPPTGTLAASVTDPKLSQERDAIAEKVVAALDARPVAENMVGLAYAVNGEVRTVRYFANNKLFSMFREQLTKTAALEALTARNGTPKAKGLNDELTPADEVASFVIAIRDNPDNVTDREGPEGNSTRYYHSARGYGATAMYLPEGETNRDKTIAVTTSFLKRLDEKQLKEYACRL